MTTIVVSLSSGIAYLIPKEINMRDVRRGTCYTHHIDILRKRECLHRPADFVGNMNASAIHTFMVAIPEQTIQPACVLPEKT